VSKKTKKAYEKARTQVFTFGELMAISFSALQLKELVEDSGVLTEEEKKPMIAAINQFYEVTTARAVPLVKTITRENKEHAA